MTQAERGAVTERPVAKTIATMIYRAINAATR
jgi:hypothetical protein